MDALIRNLKTYEIKCKDRVPRKYNRKVEDDKVANQVSAAWRDSSSDLDELEQGEDVSMMVLEDDVQIFDSLFCSNGQVR